MTTRGANPDVRQRPAALEGVRVLELGEDPAGGYAAKLLAEFGADVVKVEAPGGDPARTLLPLPDAPGADGLWHRWLHNAKRSLICNWRAGIAAIAPLLDGADIVISSVPLRGRDRIAAAESLEPEALRHSRPRLIVAHVSDFGLDGPLADAAGGELVLYALSGLLGASGPHDLPPLKHGAGVAWFTAGVATALGVMVALQERERSGHGQVVDVAALDCMVGAQCSIPFSPSYTGVVQRRAPKTPRIDLGILPCQGGYVAGVVGRDGWDRFAAMLEDPRLFDQRFHDRGQRARHMGEITDLVLELLQKRDGASWFHAAQALRLPYAPVQDAAAIAECPQLADRGFFVVVDGADGLHRRVPARPFLMHGTPWRLTRPAPLLGDTTLGDIDWLPQPPAPAEDPSRELPLRGLRIVEFGTAWAGPLAVKTLADLGADVIKIEGHAHVDNARVPPYADGVLGERFYDRMPAYLTMNTSKAHVCLELSHASAREVARRLVAEADVVLDNYTPHVLRQFGLDDVSLRALKPDLVVLSSTGYGHSGPWRDYAAYGWGLEPASGLAAATGHTGGPPVASAIPYPDAGAALHAAFAVLLAIRHRDRSGEGQWIDLAQYEIGALAAAEPLLRFLSDGTVAERDGNHHPRHAPHNLYPAAAGASPLAQEDQWLALAVHSDAEWRRLVDILDGAVEDRPEWCNAARRKADEGAIDAAIAAWSCAQPAHEAADRLRAAGVRAAAVHRYDETLRLEQLWHRGALIRADHSGDVGPRIGPGPWQRFSRTPARIRWPSPRFGQHSALVFRSILQLDEAAIAALEADGATAAAPTALARPEAASIPLEEQVALGIARGPDPGYRDWNAAGPLIPPADPEPDFWRA